MFTYIFCIVVISLSSYLLSSGNDDILLEALSLLIGVFIIGLLILI